MPELPEVEIARRELTKLCGARIVSVRSSDERVFDARMDPVGRVVRDVGRRGKWLRFELDRGLLFSHLGMTGDWVLSGVGREPLAFERVRMDVEREGTTTSARYTDPRRFGRFIAAEQDIDAWLSLGPDPLLDGIDEERLLSRMNGRKRAIKEMLLDQTLLAGVGNILAIEALHHARIDPRTPARHIDREAVRALARGLRKTIERTLDYDEKVLRGDGRARPPFRIYGRGKKPCPRCGTVLRHIVLGGRGTTFCPGCQKRRSPARARTARKSSESAIDKS